MTITSELMSAVLTKVCQPEINEDYVNSGNVNNLEDVVKIAMSERAAEYVLETMMLGGFEQRCEQSLQLQYEKFRASFQNQEDKKDDDDVKQMFFEQIGTPIVALIRDIITNYYQAIGPLNSFGNQIVFYQRNEQTARMDAMGDDMYSAYKWILCVFVLVSIALFGFLILGPKMGMDENVASNIYDYGAKVAPFFVLIGAYYKYIVFAEKDTEILKSIRRELFGTMVQGNFEHHQQNQPVSGYYDQSDTSNMFADILNMNPIFRLILDMDPDFSKDLICVLAHYLYGPRVAKMFDARIHQILVDLKQSYESEVDSDETDNRNFGLMRRLTVNKKLRHARPSGDGNGAATDFIIDLADTDQASTDKLKTL